MKTVTPPNPQKSTRPTKTCLGRMTASNLLGQSARHDSASGVVLKFGGRSDEHRPNVSHHLKPSFLKYPSRVRSPTRVLQSQFFTKNSNSITPLSYQARSRCSLSEHIFLHNRRTWVVASTDKNLIEPAPNVQSLLQIPPLCVIQSMPQAKPAHTQNLTMFSSALPCAKMRMIANTLLAALTRKRRR